MILGSQAKLENDNRGVNVKRGIRAGKRINLSVIYNMLNNPFYYGEFRYGGEWYKRAHKPLISKEIFDKARTALIKPPQGKWGAKDFAFTRYINCMGCGSKLIGEEKIKTLKSGKVNRHVYYHCSRHIGADCDEPYLKEEVLINELVRILKPEMIKQTPEIKDEFTRAVSAAREMRNKASNDSVITNYLRATIKHGNTTQRRAVMDSLVPILIVQNNKLSTVPR